MSVRNLPSLPLGILKPRPGIPEEGPGRWRVRDNHGPSSVPSQPGGDGATGRTVLIQWEAGRFNPMKECSSANGLSGHVVPGKQGYCAARPHRANMPKQSLKQQRDGVDRANRPKQNLKQQRAAEVRGGIWERR